MSEDPPALDHMHTLRDLPGPTITGSIVQRTAEKLTILTKYGIYEVLVGDVFQAVPVSEGVEHITLKRGAKLVFSKLVDGDSLMERSPAKISQIAQDAKLLHSALGRALGYPASSLSLEDCPMSDCVDCCECPVVDARENEISKDVASQSVSNKYYDDKISRNDTDDYRKDS